MLKGALQWSVYPQRTGSIYRRLWQPLQIGSCMLVLILPTPGGWKAEWTLAGKKVTQIFNPRPGRESNRGPQDWEAEILTTATTPPLLPRSRLTAPGFPRMIAPELLVQQNDSVDVLTNKMKMNCYKPRIEPEVKRTHPEGCSRLKSLWKYCGEAKWKPQTKTHRWP